MPLLSIITVNLNNFAGLKKTMQSVFEQSFINYEYIIIDGGSTDGSKGYIEQHANKLAYWVSEKDTGVYQAMNKGIQKASGMYLLFLNSGDALVNNCVLSAMIGKVTKADSELIYGNLERTFPDGRQDTVKMPPTLSLHFLLSASLCHPVTFIKSDLFKKFGLYDERLRVVADWAFFLKVIAKENVSSQYRDVNVAMFSMDGLSSQPENQDLIMTEKDLVTLSLFSKPLIPLIKDVEAGYRRNSFDGIQNIAKKPISTIKDVLRPMKNKLLGVFNYCRSPKVISQLLMPKRIPIIINSFNRLTPMQKLIESLEARGYNNIIILDNQSTYKPLLAYYETLKHKVVYLDKNYGHMALWDSGYIDKINDGFFAYTDPDVIPCENCPDDFMRKFVSLILRFHRYTKAGFALKLDDLPDDSPLRERVVKWERKFWLNEIGKDIYAAEIDTTFAVYAPGYRKRTYEDGFFNAIRTGGRYQARHLTWYSNPDELSAEEKYYKQSANVSASWTLESNENY